MNNMQNIPVEIGDMRVVFSGRLPLRDVFKDEGSYIHSHTCFELHCIISGSFSLVSGKTWTLNPGDIVLIPPGVVHATSKNRHRRLVMTMAISRNENSGGRFSEYDYYASLLGTLTEPHIFRSPVAAECFERLAALYDNETSLHKRKIFLSMLFLQIAESIRSLKEPPIDKQMEKAAMSDEERRLMIENHIGNFYAVPDSINALCEQLGLCRRQVDRIVRRLFGESYYSLVKHQKMDMAELLIRQSDLSFDEIARQMGYESYAGFYLAVKQYFGISPEELRNKEEYR